MSSFDEWYREYKHPDNFAPSLEEAYNAGMERAAEIADCSYGSIAEELIRTAVAKDIRKEIDK